MVQESQLMKAKNKSKNVTTLNECHHLFFFLFAVNFNLCHLFVKIVEQEERTKEWHTTSLRRLCQLLLMSHSESMFYSEHKSYFLES